MLTVKTFTCNMLDENCYIVSDTTGECVIIDCGAFYDDEHRAIAEYIADNHLTPVHLLCTHAHLDHNFGTPFIRDSFHLLPEYAAEDDGLMKHMPQQAATFYGLTLTDSYPTASSFLSEESPVIFGEHTLQVIATPGHTRGSVVFYCQEENMAFTGDTLFRFSVGRTDLQGGSMMQLTQSLRKLATLPVDTIIYPGHGPSSTIGDELSANPFMQ